MKELRGKELGSSLDGLWLTRKRKNQRSNERNVRPVSAPIQGFPCTIFLVKGRGSGSGRTPIPKPFSKDCPSLTVIMQLKELSGG